MTHPNDLDRRDPWLAVELRHLVALSAIEAEGTLSQAALSLGYVQSAVSGQLATLERLAGTRLVRRSRGPGPQALTEAGEVLVAYARDILLEIDAARERLAGLRSFREDGLRFGIEYGLADRVVGQVAAATFSEAAGLRLARMETLARDQLVDALTKHEIDVAVVALPLEHDGVATAEVWQGAPCLLVQAGSPLARRRRAPTLSELSRLALVTWREGRDPSRIELELDELELTPNVVVRCDSPDAVRELVAVGVGAAVLPADVLADDPRVLALPLEEDLPIRSVGIAWARAHSGDRRLRRFVSLACSLRNGTPSSRVALLG